MLLPDQLPDTVIIDADTGDVRHLIAPSTYGVYKTSLGKRVYSSAYVDLLPIPGISPPSEVQEEGTHQPWVAVKSSKIKQWNYDAQLHLRLGLCVHSRIEVMATGGMIRGLRGDCLAPEGRVIYKLPGSPNGWFKDGERERRSLVASLNSACDWCDLENNTATTKFVCRKCATGLIHIKTDGICEACRILPDNEPPCTIKCPRCGLWAKRLYEGRSKSGNALHCCNRCRLLDNHWVASATGELEAEQTTRDPQDAILSETFIDID